MASDERPVFVLGVDHSGTTIIYRMLAYHPQLTWFSQFTLRDGTIPGRTRRLGAGRLDGVLRVFPHRWQKGESRMARFVVPRPGEEGRIWDYLLDNSRDDPERLRSFLTRFSEAQGGRRTLAKRPALLHRLDLVREAFPHAKCVHIVRDGRAVALSLRSKLLSLARPDAVEPSARRSADDLLREAAEKWVDGLGRVAAAGVDLVEVRYEDLCDDVHATLRSILRRVDLDDRSFPFRRCPRTLENTNGRWLRGATDAELDVIDAIQRPFLVRYGYASSAERTVEPRTA